MLKDTKEIPMRHLILSVFNSRKLCRNPEHKCIYLAITLSALLNKTGTAVNKVKSLLKS